jgi:hypothetical protein
MYFELQWFHCSVKHFIIVQPTGHIFFKPFSPLILPITEPNPANDVDCHDSVLQLYHRDKPN